MGTSDDTIRQLSSQPTSTAPLRVLVVDDNALNLDVACALLAQWGIEPTLARDGVQAVELVTTQTFDFVLMDLVMPVMDGYAATTCIRRIERANPSRRPVPVVAYSSADVSHDLKTMRTFGFSEVVKKPSSPQRLHECLSRWCPDKFGKSAQAQARA